MIQPTRRSLLMGLLVAPVIVRASSLMAIKPVPPIEGRFDTSPEDGINPDTTLWRYEIFGTDADGNPTHRTFFTFFVQKDAAIKKLFRHISGITASA